jgi:hypothetical protein
MSDKRYLGNIITQNPTAPTDNFETTSAAGVWSLAGAFAYSKAGLWPTAGNAVPRALFAGGRTTSFAANKDVIDYVTITTTGNATDFGDLTSLIQELGAFSSSSRAVFFGGQAIASGSGQGTVTNVMAYVTIASAGNATDFGDLTAANAQSPAGVSSSTRGVRGGGRDPNIGPVNTMDYVTIASAGNATDFGDLLSDTYLMSSCNSSTRGIFSGGAGGVGATNAIQYITIASVGNATDFGDLSEAITQLASGIVSSSTRGIVSMGGRNSGGTPVNIINYVTIASTGNSADFGDLTTTVYDHAGASSTTRGLAAGGLVSNNAVNNIQYIEIASTGNSTDFGDLSLARYRFAGASNSHGGLA